MIDWLYNFRNNEAKHWPVILWRMMFPKRCSNGHIKAWFDSKPGCFQCELMPHLRGK